ncbi:GntR family transcriptional regulator [Acuticoccus sp. MNP-M23]|uniref:GntR family transcriptional regulator n=1 Tax=Acuticoccus sp. MNP-M23 TaxID=3072793 RepID=UPI002815A3E0|nr:GntR family transcriptional regulator [Acuticoccus sp. MNP-M23]WMS41918.1 GntR family transcriptional regulator [Acuticoccus sp. MNP-M23]
MADIDERLSGYNECHIGHNEGHYCKFCIQNDGILNLAKTESAAEQAYRLIREWIIAGRYAEGARLREEELASAAQTSRTPVREALRRLAAEGFVEMQPRSGALVKAWSTESMRDLFNLRALLEGHAAQLAAMRCTTEDIDALAAMNAHMIALTRHRDDGFLTAFSETNTAFHCRILRASGNPQLEAVALPLIDLALIMRNYRRFSSERLEKSCGDHDSLIAALRVRDAALAEAVMRAHILSGGIIAATVSADGSQT